MTPTSLRFRDSFPTVQDQHIRTTPDPQAPNGRRVLTPHEDPQDKDSPYLPVTDETYLAHLENGTALGVRSDGSWGCIDIDTAGKKPLDPGAIFHVLSGIRGHALPLVATRSTSGALNLWLFLQDAQDPHQVEDYLRRVAKLLDLASLQGVKGLEYFAGTSVRPVHLPLSGDGLRPWLHLGPEKMADVETITDVAAFLDQVDLNRTAWDDLPRPWDHTPNVAPRRGKFPPRTLPTLAELLEARREGRLIQERNNATAALVVDLYGDLHDGDEDACHASIWAEWVPYYDGTDPWTETENMAAVRGGLATWEKIQADRETKAPGPTLRSIRREDREVLSWLWEGWIPRGKVTGLGGDGDVGKGLLAMDLAARISRGDAMPDGTPSGLDPSVKWATLIITVEDGAEDTLNPRYYAAGGEDGGLVVVSWDRPLMFPKDLPVLTSLVQGGTEDGRRIAMVVLDRWDGLLEVYLAALAHNNAALRTAMAPLTEAAQETGAAFLCIAHLKKNDGSGGSFTDRFYGAKSFINTCRSGIAMERIPGEEIADPTRNLTIVKHNLAAPADPLAILVDTVSDTHPGAKTKKTPRPTLPVLRPNGPGLTQVEMGKLHRETKSQKQEGTAKSRAADFLLEAFPDPEKWIPMKTLILAGAREGHSRNAIREALDLVAEKRQDRDERGRLGATVYRIQDPAKDAPF